MTKRTKSKLLLKQTQAAFQNLPPIAKEVQLEFVFNFAIDNLIKRSAGNHESAPRAREQFYWRHFGQIASELKLPLKYFVNPFRRRILDNRNAHYNQKKLRSAKNYFKLVFSSESFSSEFRNYLENDFACDYLLETPSKLFAILSDLFYFDGRKEKIRFSWNIPWRFHEIQLALEQSKKSLF